MSQSSRAPGRELLFRTLYERTYPDVLRFVQRRVHPDHAEDVAAETFTVLWRRLDEAPSGEDDARAWLFGIARLTLQNQRRGADRQRALGVRLASLPVHPGSDPDLDRVGVLADLARVWGRLSAAHQEALALTVFDDLTAPQAAAVLQISPVAYRIRLSRARRALRVHLDLSPGVDAAGRALPHPEGTRS